MTTQEYTFQTLFGSKFKIDEKEFELNKIEIPIIQRDYAQGRQTTDVERIRNRFLDAMFQAIINNKHITLDFVYGDVSKNEKNNDVVLTPLDGQQRLTTLFLLHWYIAKKEQIDENDYSFLSGFSYATRFSSRDFCRELIKYTPDFNEDKLSTRIKDQAWYPYEWKNDPTIQSMLVMIDAIHEKFIDYSDLWQSLVTNQNISFYFLPLSEMGLSDELYIKMNSRGKPLTHFEHFKAEFEEIIKQHSEKLSKEINHKFDVEWTKILFPFRDENNIIDDEFMRYFFFISDIICWQSDISFEKDEFKLAKLLYNKENPNAKTNIDYFKNSFDCWQNFDVAAFFEKYFSKNTYERGKVKLYQEDLNIFRECCENYGEYSGSNRKFPLNKILLLFSIITYLHNKSSITENDFIRRIRIVRNLIWNSQYEIRGERMKTLLSETFEIITQGTIPTTSNGYNENQKEEERGKILWLSQNVALQDELFDLEDHSLLKGCIAIVALTNMIFMNQNKVETFNVSQLDLNTEFYMGNFTNTNFNKFRILFDDCNKDLINRTLLSVDDYSQLISWRYQIGAKSNDSVWSDLFHPTKQRQGFDKTSSTLNILLSKFNESDINDTNLQILIDTYLNDNATNKDWKFYIIKYDQMRKGNFGMYYWVDRTNKPYEIIMMNTEKSIGGRNWNIFLYTISLLPEFNGKLSLGEYGYQGNKLKIAGTEKEINCLNDKYVVLENGIETDYQIQQNGGMDIEDRIERGKQIIKGILDNLPTA